jgi:hypothetical protein
MFSLPLKPLKQNSQTLSDSRYNSNLHSVVFLPVLSQYEYADLFIFKALQMEDTEYSLERNWMLSYKLTPFLPIR